MQKKGKIKLYTNTVRVPRREHVKLSAQHLFRVQAACYTNASVSDRSLNLRSGKRQGRGHGCRHTSATGEKRRLASHDRASPFSSSSLAFFFSRTTAATLTSCMHRSPLAILSLSTDTWQAGEKAAKLKPRDERKSRTLKTLYWLWRRSETPSRSCLCFLCDGHGSNQAKSRRVAYLSKHYIYM